MMSERAGQSLRRLPGPEFCEAHEAQPSGTQAARLARTKYLYAGDSDSESAADRAIRVMAICDNNPITQAPSPYHWQ